MIKYWTWLKIVGYGYALGTLHTAVLIGNPIEVGACSVIAVTVVAVLLVIEFGEHLFKKKFYKKPA